MAQQPHFSIFWPVFLDDERPLTRAELMKVAGKYAKKAQEKNAKLKGLELGLEHFEA